MDRFGAGLGGKLGRGYERGGDLEAVGDSHTSRRRYLGPIRAVFGRWAGFDVLGPFWTDLTADPDALMTRKLQHQPLRLICPKPAQNDKADSYSTPRAHMHASLSCKTV